MATRMTSDQIAKLFTAQRLQDGCGDFRLTVNQTSWIMGVAQREAGSEPVGRGIAGTLDDGRGFRIDVMPNGTAIMRVTASMVEVK